jgi:hypothetical protein
MAFNGEAPPIPIPPQMRQRMLRSRRGKVPFTLRVLCGDDNTLTEPDMEV